MRDNYYFHPVSVLGINKIDVLHGGKDFIEGPLLKETKINNSEVIYSRNDIEVKISNESIFDYLSVIDKTENFRDEFINDFKIISRNG